LARGDARHREQPAGLPALSDWLSDVIASLKGQDLTVLMSQSDMNHSRDLIDVEYAIERGANVRSSEKSRCR
jgi:hypothetical protein